MKDRRWWDMLDAFVLTSSVVMAVSASEPFYIGVGCAYLIVDRIAAKSFTGSILGQPCDTEKTESDTA